MASLGELLEPDVARYLGDLIADRSMGCLAVPEVTARETVAVLRAADGVQPTALPLARTIEASFFGPRCVLNLQQCWAAWYLLSEIAETALPVAPCAAKLAAEYRAKFESER